MPPTVSSYRVFPQSMRRLINELSKLPSVGEKSATRLAYHLLTNDRAAALDLARAIIDSRDKVGFCKECFALAEGSVCSICLDDSRDRSVICIVEKPADMIALERSAGFCGLYHVLHGLWSPLRGVRPEDTKINELIARVRDSIATAQPVRELIIATSTTVEGDATAMYISSALKGLEVNISRIARGMPKGGELEYADEVTITYALEGRQKFHSD